MKVLASVLIVAVLVVFGASNLIKAQSATTFDVLLPDAPNGFAGGIMRVDVTPGAQGGFGDINCNGNVDFADVVDIFLTLATMQPVADCRTIGEAFVISGVTFPDFGLANVNSEEPDYIEFAVVDLNEIIQPGATDSLIATIELTSTTQGSAGIIARWLDVDDESGNAISSVPVKGVVR